MNYNKEILNQLNEALESNNAEVFLDVLDRVHGDWSEEDKISLEDLKQKFTLKGKAGIFLYDHIVSPNFMHQQIMLNCKNREIIESELYDFFIKTRLKHKKHKSQ